MEDFEKLVVDFVGYITIDKNDIVITEIDNDSGNLIVVDVKELTSDEIIDGLSKGNYYLSFERTYSKALDGDLKIEVEKDLE